MFVVISIMIGGIALGFLLRKQRITGIHRVITALIWLLLFLLGTEVGGNRRIMESLHTLGVEAVVITLACVAGSCVCAWGLWKVLYGRKEAEQ